MYRLERKKMTNSNGVNQHATSDICEGQFTRAERAFLQTLRVTCAGVPGLECPRYRVLNFASSTFEKNAFAIDRNRPTIIPIPNENVKIGNRTKFSWVRM